MKKKKQLSNALKNRAELSGFLFANMGHAFGIDCVPFLAAAEDKQTAKAMMKGKEEYYKAKVQKKVKKSTK